MVRIASAFVLALILGCGGAAHESPASAGAPQRAAYDAGHPGHASHDPHASAGSPHGDAHAHGHMPHSFAGAERWAQRFDDPARDQWQKPQVVIERMALAEGMVVADIGAGTGYFVPHLARAVGASGTVLALDVEPDMVRYLRERVTKEKLANVKPREVRPDSPGLLPSSTDRILIVNTWHHIAARERYAAELASSLRPGGAVVIVDFHPHSAKGPPKQHKLAPSVVAAELQSAGLSVELVLDALPEQYIAMGRLK